MLFDSSILNYIAIKMPRGGSRLERGKMVRGSRKFEGSGSDERRFSYGMERDFGRDNGGTYRNSENAYGAVRQERYGQDHRDQRDQQRDQVYQQPYQSHQHQAHPPPIHYHPPQPPIYQQPALERPGSRCSSGEINHYRQVHQHYRRPSQDFHGRPPGSDTGTPISHYDMLGLPHIPAQVITTPTSTTFLTWKSKCMFCQWLTALHLDSTKLLKICVKTIYSFRRNGKVEIF